MVAWRVHVNKIEMVNIGKNIGVLKEGTATDLDIEAKEILRLRAKLYDIIASHSGQSPEKVEKDCDRNLWLGPEEAIEYGLADRILQKAPEIVKADKEDTDE